MRNDLFPSSPGDGAEFAIYPAEDGQTQLSVRVAEETVWLSLRQMAELFQKDVRTVNEHLRASEQQFARAIRAWCAGDRLSAR